MITSPNRVYLDATIVNAARSAVRSILNVVPDNAE